MWHGSTYSGAGTDDLTAAAAAKKPRAVNGRIVTSKEQKKKQRQQVGPLTTLGGKGDQGTKPIVPLVETTTPLPPSTETCEKDPTSSECTKQKEPSGQPDCTTNPKILRAKYIIHFIMYH